MDQLIFASLSHTHYWYGVGMSYVALISSQPPRRTDGGCGKLADAVLESEDQKEQADAATNVTTPNV